MNRSSRPSAAAYRPAGRGVAAVSAVPEARASRGRFAGFVRSFPRLIAGCVLEVAGPVELGIRAEGANFRARLSMRCGRGDRPVWRFAQLARLRVRARLRRPGRARTTAWRPDRAVVRSGGRRKTVPVCVSHGGVRSRRPSVAQRLRPLDVCEYGRGLVERLRARQSRLCRPRRLVTGGGAAGPTHEGTDGGARARSSSALSVAAGSGSNAATAAMLAALVSRAA